MKKVLIFGSSGLVGSNLKNLLQDSNEFKVINPQRAEVDLFNFEKTKSYILETKPDWIINCAAKVGGILANNTYRTEFLIENLRINLNILESCIGIENIKIINLGSSCIYPLNSKTPIKEESFLTGKLEPTNSPYAIAKIASMELGKEIKNQFGNTVINLMPTNLYGPYDNFSPQNSHVIPGLIYKLFENFDKNEFIVWGSGKPLREFLYVEDLAFAIKFLIEKEPNYDLINIGSNEEVSIRELAELIVEITGFKGEIVFDKNKPDGNPKKSLDNSIMESLGWSPKTNLKEGLKKTINWYGSTLSYNPISSTN